MIEKVKHYIESNLPNELSLNSVADVVHLSPRYLSRIFKKSTGENFVDYLTNARLQAAKEKLVNTNKNIESISLEVGYNNPAYFSKKFKESFGVSPSVFRNNH